MQKENKNIEKIVDKLRWESAGYGFATDESIEMFEKHFVFPAFVTAQQQEREQILVKAKEILEARKKLYGTEKHGLSFKQLEAIINPIKGIKQYAKQLHPLPKMRM